MGKITLYEDTNGLNVNLTVQKMYMNGINIKSYHTEIMIRLGPTEG